ncbi:hypothetical protein LCGC14_2628290 [marine sediment metagenome]|uniref:Uncharacterized protein n=1 Tax=marine sediment metagenome TaxID=412755 RepID=A0A0F9ANP1_9ZZZZ
MSLVSSRSSKGARRRAARNKIGPPPWSADDRHRLARRVRVLAHQRAASLGLGPIGPMLKFAGHNGGMIVDHLGRRYAQGCLICGNEIAEGERFEVCHIDPLAAAHDLGSLARLMAMDNIGLSHVACNLRLRARPIR